MDNIVLEAFNLLDELEATTKRNEKKAILERGVNNPVLKELLTLAYDPFKKYNIVEYGEVNPQGNKNKPYDTFKKFSTLLGMLNQNILTGHEALSTVNTFFNHLDNLEYKWYSRVLKKDLRAGITSSTINNVYKNLIPVFECMLAKPWDDIKKKPKNVIIERKLDGYRSLSFVHKDGRVELFTRNGKPISGFLDIEYELLLLEKGMVYDAEIIGKDNEFNDMQKLVFNKQIKDKAGTLVIFDMLPIEEFELGKSKKTLVERKADLERAFNGGVFQHLSYLPSSKVFDSEKDKDEINSIYEGYCQAGYEGAMIKDANSFYECKRSSSWAKLKPFETIDLEVIDSVEGTGKYIGKLGALVVDFEGYPVEIGSGYNDSQRVDFWDRRNELVGKTIEIQYQEVTENEKGTKSLRFPTFKGFREDK